MLDEADRMLDMGFWPTSARSSTALPAARQTLFFSATMPDEVHAVRAAIMREPAFDPGRSAAMPPARTITHARRARAGRREDGVARALPAAQSGPGAGVRAHQAAAPTGWPQRPARPAPHAALHADRSQRERTAAVEGFRAGRYRVLVATDIAARGLDSTASATCQLRRAAHAEDYVHRVGRTGRALASGTALTLVSPGEERALKAITARIAMSA